MALKRQVEGEIFRIGMFLEDVKEQIDTNACQSFSPPPSTSTPVPPSPQPSLHEVTPTPACTAPYLSPWTHLSNSLTLSDITNTCTHAGFTLFHTTSFFCLAWQTWVKDGKMTRAACLWVALSFLFWRCRVSGADALPFHKRWQTRGGEWSQCRWTKTSRPPSEPHRRQRHRSAVCILLFTLLGFTKCF